MGQHTVGALARIQSRPASVSALSLSLATRAGRADRQPAAGAQGHGTQSARLPRLTPPPRVVWELFVVNQSREAIVPVMSTLHTSESSN